MHRYSWYTSSECLKIKGLFIGLSPVNIQTVLRMRETALKQVENLNGACKNLQFILHTSDTNKCQESLYLMPPDGKVLARFSNCEIAPTISLQSAVCLPSVETNSCKMPKISTKAVVHKVCDLILQYTLHEIVVLLCASKIWNLLHPSFFESLNFLPWVFLFNVCLHILRVRGAEGGGVRFIRKLLRIGVSDAFSTTPTTTPFHLWAHPTPSRRPGATLIKLVILNISEGRRLLSSVCCFTLMRKRIYFEIWPWPWLCQSILVDMIDWNVDTVFHRKISGLRGS